MNGRNKVRCAWQGHPNRERAYCYLFNSKCDWCPFNPDSKSGFAPDTGFDFLPERYWLSREHLWVAPSVNERVLVGLDGFWALSLYHVRGVVQPRPNSPVIAGKSCAWLIDIFGTLRLQAPVSGTVVLCNPDLLSRPSLVKTSPYGCGWLFEVEPEENWKNELMDSKQGARFLRRSYDLLKDKLVACHSPKSRPRPVADGGTLRLDEIAGSNPKFYVQALLDSLKQCRRWRD